MVALNINKNLQLKLYFTIDFVSGSLVITGNIKIIISKCINLQNIHK